MCVCGFIYGVRFARVTNLSPSNFPTDHSKAVPLLSSLFVHRWLHTSVCGACFFFFFFFFFFVIIVSLSLLLAPREKAFFCLFVLRFYDPVNPMGSCRARSVYLTTRLLGRLSPLSG